MGYYVNPGNQNFASAVRSKIYIDKTGLLSYLNSVIDTEQRYICISRPRRFGKSIAARMVAAYYSRGCDSRMIFDGLKVSFSEDFEDHLNKYNVIHLDVAYMRSMAADAMETIGYLQKCIIDELKEVYPGLIQDHATMLPMALAQINKKTGARFIIIIDEWDALFREDKFDEKAQDAYIKLLRGLFKGEQSQNFMHLAYMTGILPIKRYNNESALNNFDEFTMTHPAPLTEYTGFTEQEVEKLCTEYHMDFSEARRWYDGYSFEGMEHIYSPNSIVKAMLRGGYHNYWTGTVAYEALKIYISMDYNGLKEAVIRLLAGERCKVDVETFENDMTSFRNRDDVLTILIHLGYLGYDNIRREAYIPNEEVRGAFARAVKGTDWLPVIHAILASDALLKATWNQDEDAVAAGLDAVHSSNTSILKYNDENSLACVVRLAYYNAVNEYTIIQEMPSGKGYADIVFIPIPHSDKPAMIVELKYNKSAQGAIAQIKNRQYVRALEAYSGNLLLVGISYSKDDVNKAHECVIEKIKYQC